MNWEEQWSNNQIQGSRLATFGADTTVKVPGAVNVHHGGGGGLANGILLVLGGFAIGTLWGEPIINKLIGVKHHG
jgi:hypothetical protein